MSRLEHLTDQRKQFIGEFFIRENAIQYAIRTGYKGSLSLSSQTCKLKREIFKEINDKVQYPFRDYAPRTLKTMVYLIKNSSNNSV